MRLEELGLIGNCQYSALIHRSGDVVWCCLPRLDSPPAFGSLLDGDGGCFRVAPADGGLGRMGYIENTNVLETRFTSGDGVFRVIDFAPRFRQHGRSFRPAQLIRIIEPIEGTPRVVVRCDPVLGWEKTPATAQSGSNHIEFAGYAAPLRLTTDVSLAYIGGSPFSLTERKHLVLTWGTPPDEDLSALCDRFLNETAKYWKRWVKHCNLPPLYQKEVIRSALALKLHCFEDTGAIVAAMTTSIPESPGSKRTWDYRYCWLRDAYFSLGAFRLIGHFEEREQFLNFLLNIAASSPELDLAPLYRIDGSRDLPESEMAAWAGYEGDGPVRVGNAAVEQKQGDIYGELALALIPLFLDERFHHEQTAATLDLLVRLARKAIAVAGVPDAGLWEVRKAFATAQTFGSIMSWAAADRMIAVAERHAPKLVSEFTSEAARLGHEVMRDAWNPEVGALTANYQGTDLDASVLHAVTLRLLSADDPRSHATVDAVIRELGDGSWLYRYRSNDGLGRPSNAFVICSFWLIEALAALGRGVEARARLDEILSSIPVTGLISEDYDPATNRFWGNFPQAYSHVGLIRAAFAASPPWAQVW